MACSVCRSDKRESPMNLAPMIRIGLTMDAGRVRHVALDAARYSPAQKLFIGIPAREVPARAATVFALCPMAQSLAAELAIAAAHGEKPVVDRKRAIALGAERLGENLRSLVLSWPGATPDRDALAALRGALGALRGLADCTNAEMQTRIANLRQSATVLGFGPDDANETRWFSRLLRDISADPLLGELAAPSPGSAAPAADDRMFDLLASDGDQPPQTPARAIPVTEHLRARGAAIVEAIDGLAQLASGGASHTFASRTLGPGVGAAAVESPRGRLFHVVALDAADRIAQYRTLSPTDRNFANDGPFAQALLGREIGSGPAAERRVAQIAALYDPCVAVEVTVRERTHA